VYAFLEKMAAFFAELIRATVVGGFIIGTSMIGYKFYDDEKMGPAPTVPSVQHIRDKNLVGVRITGIDRTSIQKIRHDTECLEHDRNYKKILETETEVFFTTDRPTKEFADDCKTCKARSHIQYSSLKEDYLSWTP
jgi:hypothetical protein